MKKENEEELDKLFKKGSQEPVNEPVFREADWDAMEQLLDQKKKRGGIIYWLPRLGSVAAVLLLALLAWLFFKPQVNKPKNNNQVATVPSKPDTGISGASGRHDMADSSKQKINNPANLAQNSDHPGAGKKTDRSFPYLPGGHAAKKPGNAPANILAQNNTNGQKAVSKGKTDVVSANLNTTNAPAIANATAPVNGDKDNGNDKASLLAANSATTKDNSKDISGAGNDSSNRAVLANNTPATGNRKDIGVADGKKDNGNNNNVAVNTAKPKIKAVGTSVNPNRAIFAVTAIASSDMNGTSAFGGRAGANLGALFSVSSGKWTISTGGMYSIKPYQENFADYHTPYAFQTNPSTVGVNCKMIDIPLNVNYQVYHKGADKFTLGTGLSSYIILREDYTFNYTGAYASGPAGYSVVNRNRNYMGILNLDVTYERRINSRFGVVFEPYYKLPLENVGASQVKLQSTGLAVGLNWSLNSFKKPN